MLKLILLVITFTAMGQDLTKSTCTPFKQDMLTELFGKHTVTFIEFMQLMNSRTTKLVAGKSLESLVQSDQFDYGSDEEALKLFKMANGLEKNKFESDQIITLPFCKEAVSREIATLGNIETKVVQEDFKEPKVFSINISAQYGNLDVESTDGDISMQFIKASAGAYYKLSEDYFLTAKISAIQFRNIEHTDTDMVVSASDPYPEFGISSFKKIDKFSVGVGYDFLQYFVRDTSVSGVSLNPSLTHRISAKGSYSFTDSLIAFANLGYLKSFEENNISGIDSSVSVNYSFGKNKSYSIAPVFYRGSVERDSGSEADSLTVISLKLAYTF